MQGTITFWNNQRGFGFITIPTGEKYFFHISNFNKGGEQDVPTLEGRVRFDVGPAVAVGKKNQALNVQYIHSNGMIVLNGGTN
jgi:cold shock CspA family protein